MVMNSDRKRFVDGSGDRQENSCSLFSRSTVDSELSASIGHELGHVWIFTHHPYLQTELLANQVALRVVSRENSERIYEKVWKDKGKRGLKEFLDEETTVRLNRKFDANLCPKPPMVAPISRLPACWL